MRIFAAIIAITVLPHASLAQAQVTYQPITTLSPVRTVAASPASVGSCNCQPTATAVYSQAPVQPAPQPYYQPTTAYQPISQSVASYPSNACCDPCSGMVPQTAYYAPAATYAAYPAVTAYRPIVSVNPMPSNVYVGRGLIGQPTVYVPGQPIRNFFRFLSP